VARFAPYVFFVPFVVNFLEFFLSDLRGEPSVMRRLHYA
jgi:hypothetical protein